MRAERTHWRLFHIEIVGFKEGADNPGKMQSGREQARNHAGSAVDVLENASAVTDAPQMTHPLSTSASFIESFTSNDSSHTGQSKTYSLPSFSLIGPHGTRLLKSLSPISWVLTAPVPLTRDSPCESPL